MLDTSARLLRLLSLLQSRPTWSGPALADRLGVTTRTVRRDVDRLRQLGYPVQAAPGREGGYQLGPGAALPPLLLDDDEATAVAIALRATAGGSVQGVEEAALAALAKLDRLLPSRLRHRVVALLTATVPMFKDGPGSDAIDADLLVTLAHACEGQERVRLAYVDRNDRPSERRIEPYRLVSTGRRWYLVALDVDRAEWRTFRVDRIGHAALTGHRFHRHDPPDAAAFVQNSITIAPYRHVARILLHVPVEEAARRIPPTVGVLEPDGPDRCVLSTGADHLPSMAGHLVALGFELEVLEPPELRRHLRDLGRRLARVHAK